MKKVLCLFATAALCSAGQVKAQMMCGTDQVYNQLKSQHPEVGELELRLRAEIKQAIDEKKEALKYAKTTAVTYDIPIVVHVVHDYGIENLTDDAIFAAVNYWDVVYNAQNADSTDIIAPFKKYFGNPQIHLHLATIDPDGKPTKGITRHSSYLTYNAGDEAKLDDWPNTKYVNVWFINKFSGDHTGAAAYAYYPSSGAYLPYYDGVIGLSTYLNYDKAIPHEFGHVLNLEHTWGDTNNPEVACGDDEVEDTPPTYGHTTCGTAQLYDTRCAVGYTASGIDYPDTVNTQNIMDYSYCQKMFTIGQADRMRAALTSSVAGRNNLYSAANLTATGALMPRPDLPPVADFSVEKGLLSWGGATAERAYFLCENSTTSFRFTNRSWNDTITTVEWAFSNDAATPSSTKDAGAVANQFATPGWVTVTLKATGNNTGTSTVNKQAVYVASTTPEPADYANYFANPGTVDNWPMFNYYNNNFKWEYFSTAGYADNGGCVRYRSYDYRTSPENKSGTPLGDYDDMFTPAFDMTSYTPSPSGDLNLSFYTAGSSRSGVSGATDSMQIFVSTTCGDSWVRLGVLSGSQLANNTARSGEFIPTTSQWQGQTINVPTAYRTNKAYFRFRYWPSERGNNLYFDNFGISPWSTDIAEVRNNPNAVKLFPNPATGDTKLCFTTGSDAAVNYVIRDLTGKVVYQRTAQYPTNTFIEEPIARTLFPASGVYLVTVTLSQQTTTQKLVIQ